jgi:hypothetical protein
MKTRKEIMQMVDDYRHEREACLFHEHADSMGEDEEDCCDDDAATHNARATGLFQQIEAALAEAGIQ